MGYRRFEDNEGMSWEVWEVHPALVERRLNDDRRAVPRDTPDRRGEVEIRFPIPRELEGGWLAFQSPGEKRRLAPIPSHWMALSDDELGALCRRARPYRVAPPSGLRRPP